MNRYFGYSAVTLILLGGLQVGEGVYIEAKAWLAQQLLQKAWAETQAGDAMVPPWPWADTRPLARLRVERLGVDQIILSGASGRTLAFGPGHVDGTAAPGTQGNSVISGHRDTHFGFLQQLKDDDRIEVTLADGQVVHYAVVRRAVHHQRDVWLMEQTASRLTLITCYPFDAIIPGGPERYVVTAEPVLI